MTTSLDHVVHQMRAVQGLKAARWQRPAHPSGACTLCSRVGSRTHAENASRAAAHFGANRRLLVNRQNGHPEAPPYHLAHPAPWGGGRRWQCQVHCGDYERFHRRCPPSLGGGGNGGGEEEEVMGRGEEVAMPRTLRRL